MPSAFNRLPAIATSSTQAVKATPSEVDGSTAECRNQWRSRVGVGLLQWNSTLAASAAAYAAQCNWQHDANRSPDAGFSYVGENLYATTAMPTNAVMLAAVDGWASERTSYDYGTAVTAQNFTAFGHYTQLVWDSTTDVGCGYAYCPSVQGLNGSATIVDCRYGPGGNYLGQTPYGYTSDVCVDLDNDDVFQGADADDTDRTIQ